MPDVKRKIRLVTHQSLTNEPAEDDIPWRKWSVEIFLLNDAGETVPADIFEKVTYNLHESFGDKAKQVLKKAPFKVAEKGWGEFDMNIVLSTVHRGGEHTIYHDLNFANERYEADHVITFKNPNKDLLPLLKAVEENGTKKGAANKKGGKKDKFVDMEKLADGLQALTEDDMLEVVQMIYDYKTPDTYTKNDVDNGEFSVDLYTLPDNLVKMLWDFMTEKTGATAA